jgi:hypothetical protein
MAKTPGPTSGNGLFRQLQMAQYDAYMKIAVRKHGLSPDMFHKRANELSDEELASAVAILRDMAHLPPE